MAGYIYYGEILMGSAGVTPSTSCTITFSVNPNDAKITVNGDILSGNTYTAEIGETVSYSISKYGYGTETGSLTASTDETVTVTLVNYLTQYLTFDIVSGGTILWKLSTDSATAKTISYRKNNGSWNEITSTTDGVSISVVQGDKVEFKGSNTQYATSTSYYNYFGGTATFNASGNIMSLIGGDDFSGLTTLSAQYTFTSLFKPALLAQSQVISTINLILPATTLARSCYASMFYDCTSLTTAPELPATTLADYCYNNMFFDCTSLTTVQELPATTLTYSCYNQMFRGCTSLTTAPELPATTIANSCYAGMFYGCTSLTTAPELPATTLANSCYNQIFYGCTSLTTAPELPATTLASNCYAGMFNGCTGLTQLPLVPTTPNNGYYGYSSMFQNCTGLISITIGASVTSIGLNAFSDCSNLTSMYLYPTTPPTIQSTTFKNVPSTCAIYVPVGCAETYKAASNWKSRANYIVEMS